MHLSIEANKFTEMSVGEGLLGPENVADFIDSFDISHDCHLLIELRGLGKRGFSAKIVEGKYLRSSFRGAWDYLWAVNL